MWEASLHCGGACLQLFVGNYKDIQLLVLPVFKCVLNFDLLFAGAALLESMRLLLCQETLMLTGPVCKMGPAEAGTQACVCLCLFPLMELKCVPKCFLKPEQ